MGANSQTFFFFFLGFNECNIHPRFCQGHFWITVNKMSEVIRNGEKRTLTLLKQRINRTPFFGQHKRSGALLVQQERKYARVIEDEHSTLCHTCRLTLCGEIFLGTGQY